MKISKMLRSFKFAFVGMAHLVRFENNAQFHFLATLLVIFAGYWLNIDRNEWIIIIFAMALVWSAEAFNSAIEKLCDKVETEQDPLIGKVKDMAAAGVLFLAIAAAVVGCIIFLPKIF
ncbi:diacylglycerol kinase family protein [Lacihabitans soyangensis]|uniref:Diacylglycerol kinase family protein n=1 Tax=Lacihabitans soyangensis TaxID=869394 RepID=A0AAE3H479_9BACT|nr:diacylglycerol kinase family protein [Lacihabitans soyangensis]MCP9764623.1 diacylglycerol kinase family protein [Lacihabitans soyangensis]